MNFYGYRRPDGRVGVRNMVLILPASVCASDTARIISSQVDGIQVSFHDLVLGHLFLKLESEIPLLELTLESLHHICLGTTVEYSALDQLLGDGTGTF